MSVHTYERPVNSVVKPTLHIPADLLMLYVVRQNDCVLIRSISDTSCCDVSVFTDQTDVEA